jgi:hypothetical protein
MWGYLLLALVLLLPAALLIKNDYGKKRGCGRGCATCGNRHICHPGQYSTPGSEKRDLPRR